MKKVSRIVLALVLCGTMAFTACSTAWVSQAEQVIAVVLPAAVNILSLIAALKGTAVSTGDATTIENAGAQVTADLQLISTLVSSYDTAEASAKPGILGQIQSALATANTNLASILPALHVSDPATVNKITAIVQLVQAELSSLVALIPLVNPTATPEMVKLAQRQAAKAPPLSAKDFAKSFNKVMTAKTGNAQLDAAAAHCTIHTKLAWRLGF